MSLQNGQPKSPIRSRNILTDIWYFLLYKPKPKTQQKFKTEADRENYNLRILQRLGIKPDGFTILNIHRIGVNAPPGYMFNELLNWSGESTCWPNHLARVDRTGGRLENIRILLFGRSKYPLGMKSFFGIRLIPLFLMNAIRFKTLPDCYDFDNARYLLYECCGGYPIGFFSMYVRSSIADLGEIEPTQLFLIVGFNFFGKQKGPVGRLMNFPWQYIHNRITSNVVYRLKILCEWRLNQINRQINQLENLEGTVL